MLAALGVTDLVLQTARPDGTRPEYAAALAEARRSSEISARRPNRFE